MRGLCLQQFVYIPNLRLYWSQRVQTHGILKAIKLSNWLLNFMEGAVSFKSWANSSKASQQISYILWNTNIHFHF